MFSGPLATINFATGTGYDYISTDASANGAGHVPNQINLTATYLLAYASSYSNVGDVVEGVLHLENNAGHYVRFETSGYAGPFPDGSVTSVN
jgi:hypothetical protein